MPYIGREPTNSGQFLLIDDISSNFNGSNTSFDLKIGGNAINPAKENVIVALDGILQQADDAYTVSGSKITLTEAPGSGVSFYGVLAGASQFIESDSITNDKISPTANISGSKINTSFAAQTVTAKDFGGNVSGSSTSTGSFGNVNVAELSIASVKTLSSSIATGIAGNTSNRTSLSSSIASDIAANIVTATNNSSSVAADVAANLVSITTNSSSFASRYTNQINQDLRTSASPTFVNTTVTGTLTAQEIHTEFESASILFTSGSTKFGDSGDDIHNMTGSIRVSGSLANESFILGHNLGIGTNNPSNLLHLEFNDDSDVFTAARITDNSVSGILINNLDTGNGHGGMLKFANKNGDNHTAIAHSQDGNTDASLLFYSMDGGTLAEVMRVDHTHAIGIGNSAPAASLHIGSSDGTQYSGTAEPRESMIIQNPSGSDNTAVGLHSTLGFQVADGATSQGFINYVRTGNNTGAFTLSQRAGSSTYAESMRLESGGDIGVGTTNPDGRFHIHNNSAGSVTANGDANTLVIENNGTTGISILCPAANQAEIAFGDPDDNNVGRFAYNHPGDYFALVAGASEIMRISGSGNVHLPDNPARFGVGADVDPRAGSSFDVIQVGHTSQWYAETANAADRNVYIGNNFYHNGSYHRAIYEDQVCGIQFRAGDIRFRTTGSVPVTTNLEGGGGRSRMVVHDDGRVSVGYDQTGEHDLEHNSALVVSSSGASGPLSRNAMTVVGFQGAGSFNFGASTVTFDNIKGDGPCFTLRNLGTSHTDRGPFQVYNGSTRILETRNDGLISGDFNDTSDRDFKQNINTITSSLKEVNELRPVTFVWKQDEENGQNRGHGQTKIGFIAQEVSESIPRLVSGVSGSSSGLGINTIGVTAVLTKAIQELTQAHKDLRAMITGSSDLAQLKALVSGSSFV